MKGLGRFSNKFIIISKSEGRKGVLMKTLRRLKKQFTVVAIFALMLQSLFMWAPTAMADPAISPQFYKGASEITSGSILKSDYDVNKIELKWHADSTIFNAYRTEISYPDGSPQKIAWTETMNVWIGETSYDNNFFGQKGNGLYSYRVQARKISGSTWTEWSSPVILGYDSVKPNIVFDNPISDNLVFKDSTNITVQATDNVQLSRVVVNIRNSSGVLVRTVTPFVSGTLYLLDVSLLGLPEGAYSVKTNATDQAGNTSSTLSRSFTIDNTAPVGGSLTMKTSYSQPV